MKSEEIAQRAMLIGFAEEAGVRANFDANVKFLQEMIDVAKGKGEEEVAALILAMGYVSVGA